MKEMFEFIKKFFGYVEDENGGIVPYFDNLGKGAFSDYRHFLWIIATIILGIVIYKLAKKYPIVFKKILFIFAGLLFSTRFVNQIIRAIIGAEVPFWRAFPFHLCTAMTFLLPIVIIFDLKKIKAPVYLTSIMGGIITIIIGDYFDSSFMTFSTLEGMSAHMLLIFLPLIEIALGRFKIELKEVWKVFVLMGILLGWATLANEVFFKAYDTNYMFLKRNALPGNIGGSSYFLIYIAIFMLLLVLIVGIPMLYRKIIKNKLEIE